MPQVLIRFSRGLELPMPLRMEVEREHGEKVIEFVDSTELLKLSVI